MREQAERLGEKTSNVVEGLVRAEPHPDGSTLDIEFSLVAPALGGYEYVLFRARQPVVDLYPVNLEFEGNNWVAGEEAGLKQYLSNLLTPRAPEK